MREGASSGAAAACRRRGHDHDQPVWAVMMVAGTKSNSPASSIDGRGRRAAAASSPGAARGAGVVWVVRE